MNVLSKADKQDRAGQADINVAKTFDAASIFLEILNQFGELPPDLEQKQKYAVRKAADIRKALKEGGNPVLGPPGGEDNFPASEDALSGYDLEPNNPRGDINPGLEPYPSVSPQCEDQMKRLPSAKFATMSPSFPSDHPTYDDHSTHLTGRSENCSYSEQYHQPSYPQPPPPPLQQHIPQRNYLSEEIPPSYSYMNFQSSDASYSHQPAQSSMKYPSLREYNSSSAIGITAEPASVSHQTYHYDSSYQPPVEKIAEAHKVAKFAVGALASDNIFAAVDYLRKSLELLTNPSAAKEEG